MLETINRVFMALVLLAALGGIAVTFTALLVPSALGIEKWFTPESLDHRPDFSLSPGVDSFPSPDSPYLMNVTIRTPPLREMDLLSVEVYADGRSVGYTDCLDGLIPEEYLGGTEFTCEIAIPYVYTHSQEYGIFALLSAEGTEYSTEPAVINADWSSYESNFWSFSSFMAVLVLGAYVIVLLPVTFFVFRIASGMKHEGALPGEYSLRSLLRPLEVGRTLLQKLHSFLVSPYFWALEASGILLILSYMAIDAEIWKSTAALSAFLLSGLIAFIVPYLWCIAWWYADYREREPLRILVTLFLWGMLAGVIVIGTNTLADGALGLLGIGFLGTLLVAPLVEEFYKGAGLGLLAEHHEYNSVEDGIVFGFVIGMGFSFIEDWVYFLNNPMGSDIGGWLLVFVLRSIFFSANHGFYTAITGAIIGFLIEKKFRAPALGLLAALPVAAFFHMMHNSGDTLALLLGGGGTLIYCCFLIPLFDYGGFIVLVALFAAAMLRNRPR